MFIVWGRKAVYRRLGYVADFCSICRCARPHEVRRIGMAGHVYFITAGEGELVGFERTCRDCGTACRADPNGYQALAKKAGAIEALTRETFPQLAEAWGERLALEQRVAHDPGSLSAEERRALIREPFLRLSPKVEARFAATHLDKEVGLAAAGGLLLVFLLPALAKAVMPDEEGPVFLTALSLAVLLVIWQVALSGQRWLRRAIAPTLARALQPLRPTEAELKRALGELKAHGHKMGSKLRSADVMASLSGAATASRASLAADGRPR